MVIKKVGNWYGCRDTFQNFCEQVLMNVLPEFINDDVNVVFYNHHENSEPYPIEQLEEDFSEFISEDVDKNKKNLFIINWGWHNTQGNVNMRKFFDSYRVCNSNAIRFDERDSMGGEIAFTNKNGEIYYTIVKYKGNTIIWMLWDACHMVGDGVIKIWKDMMLPMAIQAFDKNIFLEKYSHMAVEGVVDRFKDYTFKSIYDMAKEIVGSDEEINKVIEEMISKVPVKEIVLLVNQCIQRKYSDGSHTTNKKILGWIHKWAENKWPYYIMFGRQFEIAAPYSFEIDIHKDSLFVKNAVDELKTQFPKYGPVMDFLGYEEIFCNKISESHSNLDKYFPIKAGMKTSKYLSDFLKDEAFDICYSKLLQERKFSSIAHVSINPMDFLTCSLTKHDWRSCHDVYRGQCASGPIDYLFDDGSLVAFMASNKEYSYDWKGNGKPYSWNSKSWRQIIYGNPKENSFVFCREYPQHYNNDGLAKFVREMVENCVSEFCKIPNNWVIKSNGAKKNVHYVNDGSLHYDDVPANKTMYVRHCMNKNPKDKIHVGTPQIPRVYNSDRYCEYGENWV